MPCHARLRACVSRLTYRPAPAQRPALVKGQMQLYSVEQQRSQALEAHAAAFGTLKVRLH
jgi:hypothetical protein